MINIDNKLKKPEDFTERNELELTSVAGNVRNYTSKYFYGRKSKDKYIVINVSIDIGKEHPECVIKYFFKDSTVMSTENFSYFFDNQDRFDDFYLNIALKAVAVINFLGE